MFDALSDAVPTDQPQPSPEIRSAQLEMEKMYSKYQMLPALRDEFFAAGFHEAAGELGVHQGLAIEFMAQMHLHKRCEPATMIGILRRCVELDENPAQTAAKHIETLVKHDFADYDPVLNQLIVRYEVSADVQEKIDQFMYPLPMMEKPLEVKSNTDTGYLTIRRSAILKNNHHDDDICLDHLNRVNSQALTINANVRAYIQNSWKHLDKQKEDETAEEYLARKKAFEKYDRTSKDVIDSLLTLGDEFYLTHAYDKRGRTYVRGYHVNYQGNDWNKACVEFARKEPLK